jgi:hypothetical protein
MCMRIRTIQTTNKLILRNFLHNFLRNRRILIFTDVILSTMLFVNVAYF